MSARDICRVPGLPEGERPRALCEPEHHDTLDRPWMADDYAAEDRRVARHEAAHAVVALALGRHVEYVSALPTDPHSLDRGRSDGPRWLHDAMFVLLAGRLGEEEPPPLDYNDCLARLRASRAGCLGNCDDCKVAYLLRGVWGEGRSDADLALLWTHMRATTLNLLGHPVIAEGIERVADALARRPLLLADDLAVIVNTAALRAAAAGLLPQAE